MKRITLLLWCSAMNLLVASLPVYYRVLSHNLPENKAGHPQSLVPFRGNASVRKNLPLQVGIAPLGTTPGDLSDATFREQPAIRLFLSPGEFRSVWLPVQVSVKGTLSVSCPRLQGSSGKRLASETVLFQRGIYLADYPASGRSCFLVADAPWELAPSQALWILATFHAPQNTLSDLYAGKVELSLNGIQVHVPVELSVLSEPIPFPDMPLGAFVPGHYAGKTEGQYVSYAPPWQRPETMRTWVTFWHSRGLNSPFLYHIYPELALTEGRIEISCDYLDDLLGCMKDVGMPGPLLLDMRHLSWWCHAVALDLQKREVSLAQATSTVRGQDGLALNHTEAKAYPKLARQIFRKAIRAFHQRFSKAGIPLLYLSEEEIGYHNVNGFINPKTIGYETFNPVLMEEVGRDNVCLVDNSQGYGFPGVDRGARDDIKYRSYNNWTQEALDACQGNGREPWLYNVGWNRQVASYIMRLKAKAFHQWADGWCHPGYGYWLILCLNHDGAVTTLQLERALEGFRDLGYFRLLDIYASRAAQHGYQEEAKRLQDMRRAWFGNLPVNAPDYAKHSQKQTDETLDQLRWNCIQAVEQTRKLLGEKPLWESPKAHGQMTAHFWGIAFQTKAQNQEGATRRLKAYENTGELVIDGKKKEEAWTLAHDAVPFRWTYNQENQMRARAASQEEFERMDSPSASSANVTYDSKGLYFWAGGNHIIPKQSTCGNDDFNIWSDDVFEFFWQEAPDKPEWHLIVNAIGNRTLFKNGQVTTSSGIKTAASFPLNTTGGVGHEAMVPWTAMERTAAPEPGTQWRFNICRNFNSWKQLSSWSQVPQNFGLGRGILVFGGPGASGHLKVDVAPRHLGIGRNKLTLRTELAGRCQITVKDAARQLLCQRSLVFKDGIGILDVNLPASRPRGGWWIHLTQDGRNCASVPLWFGAKKEVILSDYPKSLSKGFPLRFKGTFGYGNGEDRKRQISLQSATGSQSFLVDIFPAQGDNQILMDTSSLTVGRWTVSCEGESFILDVLPGPWKP